MMSLTDRPINLPGYLEPGICPVIMKNVALSFSLSRIGKALLNWLMEPSSNVIETAPVLSPGQRVMIVVPGSCASITCAANKKAVASNKFFMMAVLVYIAKYTAKYHV